MILNNLKIALRHLMQNKGFTLLNILGLSTGIAAAAIILLWIDYELRYDMFHQKIDRIYEVYNLDNNNGKLNAWNTTPKVMAGVIQRDYPEVEMTARLNWSNEALFSYGEKRIKASGNIVDSNFLEVFNFPLIQGNAKQVLQEPNSIVLSQSLATEIFGSEDPIGKTLRVNNEFDFMVSGVLKDLPANTQFSFKFLAPWSFLREMGEDDQYWGNNSTRTYVLLKPGVSLDRFNTKIKNLREKYDSYSADMVTFIYPFSRAHLYANFLDGKESGGRIDIIRLFALIAGFVLIIACINFMNLSTARSERRAREVGIRKTVGAGRTSLVFQFLGESLLLSFLAFLVGILLVYLSLPWFNDLVGVKLEIDFSKGIFWLGSFCIVLFTGLLAGFYPAFYLSSFNPVAVLKGTFQRVHAVITPRKVLVVMQFTFAIILIISTMVVKQQIRNAQKRNAGYSKDNVLYSFIEGDVEKNYLLLKEELLQSGTAISVTKTNSPITENWSNTWGITWKGKPEHDKTVIDRFMADEGLAKTTGVKILKGRDFDLTKFPTDSFGAIINESMARLMNLEDPIGQVLRDDDREWTVIGVVEDFVVRSPFHPMRPMVIQGAGGWFNVIHIKLNGARGMAENLAALVKIFKKYNPEYPFNYHFVDEVYARKFDDEKRTETLAGLFAALAIIISCLGLFGLASYMAEVKTKEIGIRKVLGASVSGIAFLLSFGFIKLVFISFCIAAPMAWWAMHQWLQGYTYRINMNIWMFGLAGFLALLIAFVTVSFQAIKAAIANPVKSLRTE